MDFEIDRFYEERKEIKSSGPLNLHTIIVAVGLHLAAFVLFWIAAKIINRAPEVVIPIDMTIVPPWAEQDPDDPEPDPNPPPEEEKKPEPPKPEPKPEPEPEPPKEEPKEKVEAVEQIKEKPKPKKKVFKKSEIKHPKKEKPKKKEFKRGKIIKPPKVKPPMKLPPGKGTSRDKPLSQAEIMKALAGGARFGASNQLAANEEQRCLSLIKKRIEECWNFSYVDYIRPVPLTIRFGPGGKIVKFELDGTSGDADVDRSIKAAAKRAGYISGLSAEFLKKYPEVTIMMVPKRQ